MYRRSKFNEILLEIRETMSAEAEFDVKKFVEPLLARDKVSINDSTEETALGRRELTSTAD
jgi:hypothetical protein